jgi:hypothetical protein
MEVSLSLCSKLERLYLNNIFGNNERRSLHNENGIKNNFSRIPKGEQWWREEKKSRKTTYILNIRKIAIFGQKTPNLHS